MEPELDDAEDRSLGKAVPDRFDKFALSIERSGEQYRVRVIDSPLGPRAPVAIDFSRLERTLEREVTSQPSRGRDVRRRAREGDGLRREGEALYRAIFTGDVADTFRASLERARSRGKGLLVQLHFDEAPEISALPWEVLWDPTERIFFADMADVPVVRGLSVASQAATVAPAVPPLRILALLPEPSGKPELSGAAEWARIRRHLGDLIERGQVHVERVEPPTLTELGRRLQSAGCDVLHVVAHGAGGGDGTAGALQLETAGGGVDEVSGAELARALERQQPPRLVVLSACHGASAADDDAFDGLAQHLLARGVPAIVAMRTAISDAAAVEFASSLYRQLAAGRTAEAAVIEARRELGLSEQRTEWATPVLYLRGVNVRIFATEEIPFIDVLDEATAAAATPDRRRRLAVGGLFGAFIASIVGLFLWFSEPEGHPRCPAPEGFEDLLFELVEPGVLEVEGRSLVVKEAFCIATKEVTRRDWSRIMESDWDKSDPADWPANKMPIAEAREFAARLSERESPATYRLPTDVEWEYAARAGEQTRFFFGDDEENLDRYGNCDNPRGDGAETLASVGSYRANPWGLYDVHGNVAEYVEIENPSEDPEADRLAESPPATESGPESEKSRRLGGSYENPPQNCAFDFRSSVKLDNRYPESGLRLVREPDPPDLSDLPN